MKKESEKDIKEKIKQIGQLYEVDLDKAKIELEKIDPKSLPQDLQFDYYYLAGDIYYDRNELDDAIISYNLAFKNPEMENEDKAKIYKNLSSIYWEKESYKKALDYARKAIKLSSNHRTISTALSNIALSFRSLNDYQKSTESLLKILKLCHEKRTDDWSKYMVESAYASLSMNYWKLGNEQKSDYYIDKLLSVKDADPHHITTAYLCKAHRYYEKREWKDALEYYTKAVEFIKDKEDKENYQSYIDNCKEHITVAAKKRRF